MHYKKNNIIICIWNLKTFFLSFWNTNYILNIIQPYAFVYILV